MLYIVHVDSLWSHSGTKEFFSLYPTLTPNVTFGGLLGIATDNYMVGCVCISGNADT
jgi:hypothetical protein